MQKPVIQEQGMGCGLACTAFICRTTYTDAKKYFAKPSNARSKGFICKDIVAALAKAGKTYNYRYIKRRMRWKEGMIVFIKRSKRYPCGHFLARTKDAWMDPWKNMTQSGHDVRKAKAGFRKRLPGTPIYAIFPE